MNTLCIRHETKSPWERRAPLAPIHIEQILKTTNGTIGVQPSETRIFPDDEYTAAGATLQSDPNDAPIIIGVKEMPLDAFANSRTYLFFSHTMKGQAANMPALTRLLDLGCTLIDYELITDDAGRRLVAFGPFAGVAGAIDTIWTLGQRLDHEGIATPFNEITAAHQYGTIADAEAALRRVGKQIQHEGVPPAVGPVIIGVLGYGGVASGANRMLDCLPMEDIAPDQLQSIAQNGDLQTVYRCVFREEHLVRRRDGSAFVLNHYYQQPELFEPIFARHLPHLTMLINCIYWDERYPRFVTRGDLTHLFNGNTTPRLRTIGDITCDVNGSLACTTHATTPDAPVYVYDPQTGNTHEGVAGNGPVVLAVDFLPCEVPYDATLSFGAALRPFIPGLMAADFTKTLDDCGLPPELARAVIAYRGELTPRFQFLSQHL